MDNSKFLYRILLQDKREGFNVAWEMYGNDTKILRENGLIFLDDMINNPKNKGLEFELEKFELKSSKKNIDHYIKIESHKKSKGIIS